MSEYPVFRLGENFVIDTADMRVMKQGLRIAVIGESGSGKSWLMALIAEQAITQGLQVMIIDPHGEYWTFAEKFPGVVVVGGDNADLPISEDAIDVYAEAYRQGKIIDFNLKEHFTDEEAYGSIVERILRQLWKVQVNEARPALWIMEEAQMECPQEKSADVMRRVGLVKAIATGGRKFGVLLALGTQRPAELHKTPLSQCWLRVFGKLTEKLDRDAVKDYMRPESAATLMSMVTGEFYVFGWASEPFKTTITSERITRHGAETPLLAPIERAEVTERASIDELRKMLEEKLKKKQEERSEIAVLKGKLTAAEKNIERLQEKSNVRGLLRELLTEAAAGGAGAVPPETLARLEELEKREVEFQEMEAGLKTAREYADSLEAQLRDLEVVKEGISVLRRGYQLLGIMDGGTAGVPGAEVDIGRIVDEVMRRMPAAPVAGGAVLEAKEFILKDYQQREVERITEAVSKLSADQKNLLRFVCASGRVDRREAARAVFGQSVTSFRNRSWADNWNKERLFPLVDIGAVKWDSSHGAIAYILPETIKSRLEVYRPTPAEVDQVVATVANLFARDKLVGGT